MAVGDPPHSELHPMKAIFVIPSTPPPSLPRPEQWSPDFKEFLRRCLVKAEDRPTADELLKRDPFVRKGLALGRQVLDLRVSKGFHYTIQK